MTNRRRGNKEAKKAKKAVPEAARPVTPAVLPQSEPERRRGK